MGIHKRLSAWLQQRNSRFHSQILATDLAQLLRAKKVFYLLNSLLIALFVVSQFSHVFDITLYRSFAKTEWDEPFTLARGITFLNTKGDPFEYDYGGTSILPSALAFWSYKLWTGQEGYFKKVDQKQTVSEVYVYRKIYPIKVSYIVKIIATVISALALGAFCFLFCRWFLPAPALPLWMAASSGVFGFYSSQMLPSNHLGYLAGITVILFFQTFFEADTEKKMSWLKWTCVATSLTIACKVSAAYLLLLPVSFLPAILRQIPGWRERRRFLFSIALCLAVPYLLFTPVAVLHPQKFITWMEKMSRISQTNPWAWVQNAEQFYGFVIDIALVQELSILSTILLLAAAIVIVIKRDWLPGAAFLVFVSYSMCFLLNMGQQEFYSRHMEFLILPIQIFLLLPLYWLIQRASAQGKEIALILISGISLGLFPYATTIEGFQDLAHASFAEPADRDTRDEFFDFVRAQKARVYLYDVHRFSMPETPEYPDIIPFANLEQLPGSLAEKDFVAYILYTKPIKNPDYAARYAQDVGTIEARFERIRIFGPVESASDFSDKPQENPTIVLLKSRSLQPATMPPDANHISATQK